MRREGLRPNLALIDNSHGDKKQAMVQIRIGFIGDSITHGTGDETLLGWPTRAAQAEVARGHDVTVYNLGIRADTSELVAERWEAECKARLKAGFNCATIFAIGINDSAHEKSEIGRAHV